MRPTRSERGVELRQAPALTMQWLGWTPILFDRGDDPDSVVAQALRAGAIGLKLYAQLDSVSVRRLTTAAHKAGLTVWGHAWPQPANVGEQTRAGMDGVVHAAGMAGELLTPEERDTLVNDGALQAATARIATAESADDPRVLATLDSMAVNGVMFSPPSTRPGTACRDARVRHVPSVRATSRAALPSAWKCATGREARGAHQRRRSCRLRAVGDRASLWTSSGWPWTGRALAHRRAPDGHATPRAIGGTAGRQVGTIVAGNQPTSCS
jgi:hypothetical protein